MTTIAEIINNYPQNIKINIAKHVGVKANFAFHSALIILSFLRKIGFQMSVSINVKL